MSAGRAIADASARHSPAHSQTDERAAWWLWWNLLSLDAPTVAVLWASLFAKFNGVGLTMAEYSVLAVCVWIVYVSDRLLDVRESKKRDLLTARHRFCSKHATPLFGGLAVAATAAVCTAAEDLPSSEAWCGLFLSAAVIAYMIAIHARAKLLARFLPKEVIVGIIFALGTTLPVWSRHGFHWASFSWIAFALLCTLNCLAIECWERPELQTGREPAKVFAVSLSSSLISSFATVLAVLAFSSAVWLGATKDSGQTLFAVSFGALLLLVIHQKRSALSGSALRVLADAALVFPAILVWVLSK